MSAHTPGPWKYVTNVGPTQALIVDADGATILQISTNVGHRSEFAANVAFAVTACNSHADLLAALHEVLRCSALPELWAAPVRAAIARAEVRS